MDKERGAERVYIGVDPSRVARCKWCGSAESSHWISFRNSQYCSRDCLRASESYVRLAGSVFCQILVVVMFAYEQFSFPFMGPPPVPLFLSFEMLPIALSLWSLHGVSLRTKIPEGSRMYGKSLNPAALKRVAYGTKCPNCGGTLNPRRIGNGMNFTCDYCGTTGIMELYKSPDHEMR